MASSSKSKGAIKTNCWRDHLRPFFKRLQNKAVRRNGKKQTKDES